MKKTFLIILLFGSTNIASGQSFMSNVCCKIFGNTNVKQKYNELVQTALQSQNVKNPQIISVKKMNKMGSIVALNSLSSFTAFGVIWLDEEYFDALSEQERCFQINHEVSHFWKNHIKKQLFFVAGLSTAATAGLFCLNKMLSENEIPYSSAITTGMTTLFAAGIYLGLLPLLVKKHEKEADLTAAKALDALGNSEIVMAHIESLKRYSDDGSTLWWPSNKEQIEYLEGIL